MFTPIYEQLSLKKVQHNVCTILNICKKTAQSVLDKVDESVNDKKTMKLNEEFNRMQQLMGYKQKTQ